MALTNIVQGIANLIAPIGGVGKVLDYSRYTPSEKARIDTYVSGGILNCWIVTRESTAAHDRGAGPNNVRDRHTIVIEGYRAVTSSADSERLHQETTESIRALLHNNRMLPGSAGWLSEPVQVERFSSVMFFNSVLAWHSRLTVVVEEIVQGG